MSQPDEPEFPDNEEINFPGDEELAQTYTYDPENVDLIDDDSDDDITYERSSTPTEETDNVDDVDETDDVEDNLTDNEIMDPTPIPPGINPALYKDDEDKMDDEDDESDDEDSLKKL
jgi:hypothetical protein